MEKLKSEGYVVLNKVFSEEALRPIRELTDRIIKYGESSLKDPFESYYLRHRVDQGALYDLFQRHPEFQDLAKSKEILEALTGILGDDIFLYENSLVYKPKGKSNEVPWHQDFIDRPNEPTKLIAWIALDDVKVSNGALKVIPESHKIGFLPWHTVKGETHHTRVNTNGVDFSKAKYIELNSGDVLIFHQLLLHGSDKVDANEARRAYRISYQGFDNIFTPRGTPIVVHGGSPESLSIRYPDKFAPALEEKEPKKSLFKRALNKLGRKLSEL